MSKADGPRPRTVFSRGSSSPVLVRLGAIPDPAAARFAEAASKNGGALLVDTNRFDECVLHAVGASPACLLTSLGAIDDPAEMARILNPDDPVFRRVAVVLLLGERPRDPLAERTAWDTVAAGASQQEVDAALRAALVEAELRLRDCDEIEDFHRRRSLLTKEEAEVLEAVCDGKLNKQIAAEFGISIRTVEQRRRRVFTKMGVESAVPLARKIGRVEALDHDALRRDPPHRAAGGTGPRPRGAAPIDARGPSTPGGAPADPFANQ